MAYQSKKHRKFVAAAATATLVASAVAPAALAAEGTKNFSDVANHWGKEAIDYLVNNGVLDGYPDGTFQPNGDITRAEAATIIAKTLELEIDETATASFADAEDHWASAAIAAIEAQTTDVINGYEDGTFRPDDQITRQEMAKMIVTAYELEANADVEVDFTDNNGWGAEFVNVLASLGVVQGQTTSAFAPEADVTRAETATFVHRAEVPAERVVPTGADLEITGVTALDNNNRFLEITFNKPVADLETSDITVENADTLARHGVKEVTLSSNGLVATVELYSVEDEGVLQYLQDYDVKVSTGGETIEFTFNRPAFTENRITDINVEDREFTVSGVTVNVPSDVEFDFFDAYGRDARVWYNEDRDLVNLIFDNETVVDGAVEVTKAVSSTEDGEIEVAGEKYDLAEDFDFYLNDEKVSIGAKGAEYDSAKVFFDKNGDVELIVAYTWTNDLFVVEEVEETVAISFDGTEIDLEDYIIFKDGEQISVSDLEAGDVLYYNADANDEDGVAEVYNYSVTGEIDNVFATEIEVDGERYEYDLTKWLDEDTFEELTSDDAEEFQAGGEATLFFDKKGDLVFIKGAQEEVEDNTVAGHLFEKVVAYNETGLADRGTVEIELVDENQETKLYKFNPSSLDVITFGGKTYEVDEIPTGEANEVDEFQLIKDESNGTVDLIAKLKNGGKEVDILTDVNAALLDNSLVELTFNDDGAIEEIEFLNVLNADIPADGLKLDDSYIKAVGGSSYRLESDTIVFDGAAGYKDSTYKPKAKEIKVTTWGELAEQGFEISDAKFVVDGNNVEYLVIEQSDADETTNENALVTDIVRNTDGEVVEISAWVNGEEQTFEVDEVESTFTDSVEEGDIVILEINDDSGIVEDIKQSAANTNHVSGAIQDISVSDKEIKVGGNTYELISNGTVLDATDADDITEELFSELEKGDEVVIQLDENGSLFAESIILVDAFEEEVEEEVAVDGTVTYIDSDYVIVDDQEIEIIGSAKEFFNEGLVSVGTDISFELTTGGKMHKITTIDGDLTIDVDGNGDDLAITFSDLEVTGDLTISDSDDVISVTASNVTVGENLLIDGNENLDALHFDVAGTTTVDTTGNVSFNSELHGAVTVDGVGTGSFKNVEFGSDLVIKSTGVTVENSTVAGGFEATQDVTFKDTVTVTGDIKGALKITVTGDDTATKEAVESKQADETFATAIGNVTARSFNTHLGTNYTGVNASFNIADDIDFSKIKELKVNLYSTEGNLIATNTGVIEELAALYEADTKIFSTPFIVEDLTYNADEDKYWTFGEWTASENVKPAKAELVIVDVNDNEYPVANETLSEPTDRTWADIFAEEAPAN